MALSPEEILLLDQLVDLNADIEAAVASKAVAEERRLVLSRERQRVLDLLRGEETP